jgi:phage gpG-like protein
MDELCRISEQFQRAADAARSGVPTIVGQAIAHVLVADVRGQFYDGRGPDGQSWAPLKRERPQGGTKPLMNSGVLANSYTAKADPHGVTVGSTHPAAGLHQFGGVVRPVKARALTIPLTKEAARVASPRRFPRPLFVAFGGLVERIGIGKRAKIVKHYVFARSVTVPARPVGFSRQAQNDAAELLLDYYEQVA